MEKSLNTAGISTCRTGEEKHVYFNLPPHLRRRGRCCQYDYRTEDGELFSCVAPTLDKCREKRDRWLQDGAGKRP